MEVHLFSKKNLSAKVCDVYSCQFHVLLDAVDEDMPGWDKPPAETRRYPKRNIARKNYQESSDEDSDPGNWCFCESVFVIVYM